MIKTKSFKSIDAYQELSRFVIYYHYLGKACEMSIDENNSNNVYSQNDYDYEDYIKEIDMSLASKVCNSMFGNSISSNSDEEIKETDIFKRRMIENKMRLLNERESIVRNILSKEKELIEYFYPIIMKKGHLSSKNANRYLKKFESQKQLVY